MIHVPSCRHIRRRCAACRSSPRPSAGAAPISASRIPTASCGASRCSSSPKETCCRRLSLEMLRVASGAGSIGIVTSRTGIRGATVGSLFMPTDAQGRAYPYFTPSYDARYVSAADILDGSYDLSRLRGGAMLLGVTALGLVDEKQTPVGLMPGVEVHAQLFESMLTGNLLRRPAIVSSIEIALVVAIGLLTIFALPYHRPSFAIAVVAALRYCSWSEASSRASVFSGCSSTASIPRSQPLLFSA